jgi:phosphotransferase system HPr (HPr) family protein
VCREKTITENQTVFPAATMTGDLHRQTVRITNPQGFHMRPMAAFVEAANRFPCKVTVLRAGKEPANGKSILALMGLVAVQGTELVIEVAGPSAADALQALTLVFQHNYEE